VNIVKTENWVIYSYWNQKHKRTELGSIALFEMAIEKYGLNPYTRPEIAEEFSSYAGIAYTIAYTIHSMHLLVSR
jgi:hypothetical protein